MMKKYKLREIKKAQVKLDCLNAMHDLCQVDSLKNVSSKALAKKANITEMTFFNYFAYKEELLLYYMRIWSVDQMALQIKKPLKGEPGIRRLFKNTAAEIENNPTLMLSLIGYIASINEKPIYPIVTAEEIYLRFPELDNLQSQSIKTFDELITAYLNDMTNNIDINPTLSLLRTSFYGDALNAHITKQNVLTLYNISLDHIFEK